MVAQARCVLFAYHEMGYACMEALLQMGAPVAALFTHRDSPGEQVWWRSCAELAARNAIARHAPERFDRPWISRLAALRPDVIYSFSYRMLLPQEALRAARLGSFNLHPSLLPAYRGRAPVNWVLVNGERQTGVTLHRMVARADAGDIVAQRALAIDEADTALTLYRKLVPLGVAIIREYHPRIAAGCAPSIPQDLSRASYFGRRRPEDGLIDWNWPSRRIYNLVRAVTHPYPGAFSLAGGRKLLVWRARVGRESGAIAQPGTLIRLGAGEAEVAAGSGTVVIERAQFEGGEEAAADEALDAVQFASGHTLG